VLGEYTEWDTEASITGAKILARLTPMDEYELCRKVKKEVAINMALSLMGYMFEGVERQAIEKILRGDYYSQFKVNVPVILLGGPVRAYVEELGKLIDAQIIVPEHAEVGNAVGALVGKGIKRIEILVKSFYEKSQRSILVFSPEGRKQFETHQEAVEYATKLGNQLILDYMVDSGIEYDDIDISVKSEDLAMEDCGGSPIETRLVFFGVGIPKKE
jgi:N-methylhydantoinase A/oxoprolinase/acetone carboxylase beta subunit